MATSDLIFVFDESTELSPPKPSLAKRLSKKLSRKPFTEHFIRGIDLEPEPLRDLQESIEFTKKQYKQSPMLCINILVNVAVAQLSHIQQTVLIRLVLNYEQTHFQRQSVLDHLHFLLGLDKLSDSLNRNHH
jgi:hypothetical protein